MRKIVAVVGNSLASEDSVNFKLAFEVGKLLIDNGYRLQCGGLNGVMLAACKGAHASEKYREGDVIGILPGFDSTVHNPYVDIPIATGLDLYRNVIVANANAVIAVGGGSGTLSEIANAWAMHKLIVGLTPSEGWGSKLAGAPLDTRKRYNGNNDGVSEDKIYAANTPEEAISIVNDKIDYYIKSYSGITPHN
ncbi:MAG TPA: TIGR00725 family protein [Clostridia bacterium]|jgi:hypothetical protein|nr:TIGR00725 family protein [Clostridia bacterium]